MQATRRIAKLETDIKKVERLEAGVGKVEATVTKVEGSVGKVEGELRRLDRLEASVGKVELETSEVKKNLGRAEASLGTVKTLQDSAGNVAQGNEALSQRLVAVEKQVGQVVEQVKGADKVAAGAKEAVAKVVGQVEGCVRGAGELRGEVEEVVRRLEGECKLGREAKNGLDLMDIELKQAVKTSHGAKATVDELGKKIDRMQKEEEAARLMRKDQSTMSVEDVRKDLARVQEQGREVEEQLHKLQKITDSAGIDTKNSLGKLGGELELLMEKMKSVSLGVRDDKFKTEEKMSKLEEDVSVSGKSRDDLERKVTNLVTSQAILQTTATAAEATSKASAMEIVNLKGEVATVRDKVEKAAKAVEENGTKIFDCVHDCTTLKDSLDKVKRSAEKRPAAEDVDKKSELSNKLYNDLAMKIEDVDSNLEKEVKRSRSDSDKYNKDLAKLTIGVDEGAKEVKFMKEDITAIKLNVAEVKNCPTDISTLKTECDKTSKDVRGLLSNIEDVKKDITALKVKSGDASSASEKITALEKALETIKKDKPQEKFAEVEKGISSLRADHEKLNKEVKVVSTEVKFFDSNLKKQAADNKTEFSNISKTVKEVQKSHDTLHNMVEVLNNQSGSSDDLSNVKSDLVKVSTEIKETITTKIKAVEDTLKKKIAADISESDTKTQKTKDELTSKLSACTTDIKALEKKIEASSKGIDSGEVDKRVKVVKDELTSAVDTKIKTAKDELTTKVTTCTNEVKALEKRIESNTKGIDSGEVDKRIKSAKDEMNKTIETKLKTSQDDFNTKVNNCSSECKTIEKKVDALPKGIESGEVDKRLKAAKDELNTSIETKMKATKDELTTKVTNCSTEVKSLEKKIEANTKGIDSVEVDKRVKNVKEELTTKMTNENKALEKKFETATADVKKVGELSTKVTKQEENIAKLKTTVESLETSNKSSSASGLKSGDELKKEMDKMNEAIKASIKVVENKVAVQETAIKGIDTVKTGLSSVETKVKEIDSLKTNVKSVETKVTAVETTTKALEKADKEITDKIGGCFLTFQPG